MNRQDIQQQFPDTYVFFKNVSEKHPFWVAVESISIRDAKAGKTLLTDLEQMFASLHLIDGYHALQRKLEAASSEDELMELLTRMYIAYIYRNHGARVVTNGHPYQVEVEVADQLLALGVVRFKNFTSLTEQFEHEIEEDIQHMKESSAEEKDEQSDKESKDFLTYLQERAKEFTEEHPGAHHQVLATIGDWGRLWKQRALERRIARSKEEMQKHFPHIAGVVVVDPSPGEEKAKFIPFHEDDDDLEILLDRKV